ncbi:hypothetical protein [Paenirhodobacter sp.]|uniref:hypothetical protein n=1 Tax=Paenirhodobacter sp. TaxID=1965326 RepID=UPI003B5115CA
MIAVIARIIMRYLSGALVAWGLITAEAGQALGSDADLTLLLGVAIGAVAEWGYALAKKYGWAT